MEGKVTVKALRALIREELIKLVREDATKVSAPARKGRSMSSLMSEGLIGQPKQKGAAVERTHLKK